jgi:uncharacterized protein
MKALNEIPEAWRLAMQRERDSWEFYSRMAQSASDEGTRSLLEMLAEQEKKHFALLEAEYRRQFEPDLELGKEKVPLAWYEWEEESFRLAGALEIPIMLYVTAPWCEPCHLMERTTLAAPEVVDAINATVIPILVDADKRPDVDNRYSDGGWPTTAFLDAEGNVIETHNFLTAEEMLTVLRRIQVPRPGQPAAERPAIGLRDGELPWGLDEEPQPIGSLTPELVDDVLQMVVATFDQTHGGFGDIKFHHASVLEFVLALAHRTGDPMLNGIVHQSLEAMAQSSLYDKAGGGFFRYAASADWSEPHYEKMAGDQGQLLKVYLRAYKATGRAPYLDTARGVLRYIEEVLWDRQRGYFYSSQEADADYYALDVAGRRACQATLVARTVYTERNAAVASGYLLASAVLDDPRYADLAVRGLEFVWQQLYREGLGMHHYLEGQPRVPGLLSDQVAMTRTWLDAYEHFGREVYLQRAQTLMRFAENALRDADGRYYDTVAAPEALGRLRRRQKPFCENVLAAEANLRLYRVTGREEYRDLAQHTLEALVSHYPDAGYDAARFALTVDRFLRRPLLITIIGENEDPGRADLVRAAGRTYASNKTVQAVDPLWEPARLERLGYPPQPAPAAYVCLGTLCARPTADPDELMAQAQAMVGQERVGLTGSWEYQGYIVDEGFKPEPRGRFQYFLRVFEGDKRLFRYCLWTSKQAIAARWPDLDPDSEEGRAALAELLRTEGHRRLKAKIDARAFENWILDLRAEGEEEIALEKKNN